ncbi:MAG: recombination protein RecR [Caldithrix sp.]|nr:recombination protein RecR [Caldithrix sp.]
MVITGIQALDNLINELSKLPGIGRKTAQRLAVFILKSEDSFPLHLSEAIRRVQEETRLCQRCFNIAEDRLCRICADPRRDKHKICVVEDIVDVMAIEGSNEYNGLYHVLGGVISPLAGVAADDLRLKELVDRCNTEEIQEILLALNSSTEGEATMIYISKLLRDKNIRLTRIASGIPMGSNLEFIDTATIGRAILTRQNL